MPRLYRSLRFRVLSTVLLALFAAPQLIGAAEIQWLTDLDTALQRAREEERNVFVLVTAPSWCPPCRELDETTLTSPAVARWLNGNFVPLRLEDSNPQHALLEVPAMPAMFVLDASGGTIAVESGVMERGTLLDWAALHGDYLSGRKIALEDGLLRHRGDEQWELRRNGTTTLLRRYDEDERFIYLEDPEGDERYFAVAKAEAAAFRWRASDESWQQLPVPRAAIN